MDGQAFLASFHLMFAVEFNARLKRALQGSSTFQPSYWYGI